MRVEIVDVGDKLSQGVEVTFSTLYGVAKGLWVGPTPKVSSSYHVELEIDEELVWGRTIIEVSSEDFSISQENERVLLQGKVEAPDADGVFALRIGESIILLQVTGKRPSPGTFVKVTNTHVLLYDSNI